jgi:phage tail sheath protein FI
MPKSLYPGVDLEELPGVFHSIPGLSPATAGFGGLTDSLNLPLGRYLNRLRVSPTQGSLIWGARTSNQDQQWQYVNVRRYMTFIEQSLSQGLQWVVFENNGPALWSRVSQSVGGFLSSQWLQGSLQGTKKDEAFFVTCNTTTMTQNDIDNGRLVVVVGIAPVYPAEFVVFQIGIWTQKK